MVDYREIRAKLKLAIIDRYGGDDKRNLMVLLNELLNNQRLEILKTIKKL